MSSRGTQCTTPNIPATTPTGGSDSGPAASPEVSKTTFDIPIRLPDDRVSCKVFMRQTVATLRASAINGAIAVMEEATQTDAWTGLGDLERLTLELTLRMAAEELVVNSIYYGILQIDPDNKVALVDRSSLDERVKREALPLKLEKDEIKARADALWVAAVRELHDALRNPDNRERSGRFSVRAEGADLVVSVVDSGKFPKFQQVLADARIKLDDPEIHPHGRGLVILCDMFDSYSQDPQSGEITFRISIAGIRARAEQSERDYRANSDLRAREAAEREAARKAEEA